MFYFHVLQIRKQCGEGNWLLWFKSCGTIRQSGMAGLSRAKIKELRHPVGIQTRAADLIRTERTQLRWCGHLVRELPICLPEEVPQACPSERRHQGTPRTRWRDYVSTLKWCPHKIKRLSQNFVWGWEFLVMLQKRWERSVQSQLALMNPSHISQEI